MSRIPEDTGDRGFFMDGYNAAIDKNNKVEVPDYSLHNEYMVNQMKLLRMDFITYTNKVEHEVTMVKKELRAIKESLGVLIKKRPEEWLKKDLNQIKEDLRRKK